MESEQKIRAEIKRLLGAVAHSNHPEAMKTYKGLYKIGPSVIPYLKESLFRLDFSGGPLRHSGAGMLYVTSLVSLIHDIDEEESKRVAAQLIQNGCGKTVAVRLKSINEFTIKDYRQYEIKGVKVFEYKNIQTKYDIRSKLEKWFRNVPDDDLKEVERVYVIPKCEQEYVGQYTPIFYNIKLVWDEPGTKMNPLNWFDLMILETVLYHEIGHHIHRHTFGQVKEQEDEADDYSFRIFYSSRPTLHKILKSIYKVVNVFRYKPKLREAA